MREPCERKVVSIHAPRAGRDCRQCGVADPNACFNPRAPRGARHPMTCLLSMRTRFNPRAPRGARPIWRVPSQYGDRFQSTRPARGATWPIPWQVGHFLFQSTRPARGATSVRFFCVRTLLFQSTRPARGATPVVVPPNGSNEVSIHAPRAGRDAITGAPAHLTLRFNPRAPRGARLDEFGDLSGVILFQSTRPARGATRLRCGMGLEAVGFNPRAPRGARHGADPRQGVGAVSIHAPRAGRDR